MKRKIIALTITAIATASALIGQNAIISATNNMISVENIVDWNTNGTELALSLSDGTEVYAYKSEDVYKPERIQYIATGNIVDVQNTDTGFTIICADGSGYYFEK